MEEAAAQKLNRYVNLSHMAARAKTYTMRRHYISRRDAIRGEIKGDGNPDTIKGDAKPIPATADGKEPTILAGQIAELLNQNGPMRSVAIMKATGATRDTVHRCLRRFFRKAGDCLWTFKS